MAMEVPGQRSIGNLDVEKSVMIKCQPCKEDGKDTPCTGLCQQCRDNMCQLCFGHHRKAKVCKDHVYIEHSDVTEETITDSEVLHDLEKCPHHLNELVKFYCPTHDCVGCGDCIIIEHKNCKIQYIPKLAKGFKNSLTLKDTLSGLNDCSKQIELCVLRMSAKKNASEEMHEQFIAKLEAYRVKLIEHVNKLTEELRVKADDIHNRNTEILNRFENKVADKSQEMSVLNEGIESVENKPNQLFVTCVNNKIKIAALRSELNQMKTEGDVEEYMFVPNHSLNKTVMGCKTIGSLKSDENDKEEISGSQETDDAPIEEVPAQQTSPDAQDLMVRKLRAEHINIDGEYLSISRVLLPMINGYYIGDVLMTTGSYFEVEIIESGGNKGSVGIGIVPEDFPRMAFPGWVKGSAGYHSDDGRIFIEQKFGEPFGPMCGNSDTMGCGIARKTLLSVDFYFTRNGQMLGQKTLRTHKRLYPAIAMDTKGQKVKVKLNAKSPVVI